MLEIFIPSLICILMGLVFFFKLKECAKQKQSLLSTNTQLQIQIQVLQSQIQQKQEQNNQITQDYQRQLQNLDKTYQQNLQIIEHKLKENYQTQNTLLLAQNKNMIHEDSKKILEEIFTPIKEQIQSYSKSLIQNETKIETQIKNMFDYAQKMGENADKLAQVLKGDKKARGNFGELQLKNILENSGLIEGEQYKLQEHIQLDGQRYIPDAIIYLQRDKSIIIDAKFSLPSHFDFQEIDEQVALDISQNLKKRIDELSKKPYAQMQENTYDFILLFIPYQNILDLALQADKGIYQYAYEKKIYLTTPHTLFMALKTISITWLNTKRNENVLEAFREIGNFHDKFVGVVESFEEIKTHLERLQKATSKLDNQLIHGQGNLLNRFQRIQDLGAKTKKQLKNTNQTTPSS